MAMKPRTPTFRTQTPVRSVYETFQPKSEMKESEEAYFLHLYLPGFIKERIKINCVAATRTLKVLGERPILGSHKWSRFDQSYPIPENCEVQRLDAKFEHGTLIVTMPKKFTYSPKPQVVEKTTKEKSSASPRTPPTMGSTIPSKSPKVEEEHFRDKKSPSSPGIVKGLNDLTKLKGTQKDTSLAPKPKDTSHSPIHYDKGKRALEPFMDPQKGQEKIEPKPKLITVDPTKQIEDDEKIRQKTILETVRKQLHGKGDEKERVLTKKEEEDRKMPYDARKVDQKYVDHNMVLEGKEIKARKESPKGEEYSSVVKAAKKEMETIIDKAKGSKGKGIKEVAASASQVVKRIREGKLDEEEKPLVANMGAAILVIVGLGAYVTYKFTSSSKT